MADELVVEELEESLQAGRIEGALEQLSSLHPADQADLLSELPAERRAPLLARLSREQLAGILEYLKEEPRERIIRELDPSALGAVLDEAQQDIAVDVLHSLSPEQARAVLRTMRSAGDLAPLLPYADESAGGRMTSDFVALHKEWTVDQALSYLRRTKPQVEQAFYLYVVDDEHRLEGVVSLRSLVVASPEERIGQLMTPDVFSVEADEDQEEAALRIQRYNFVALPVVDVNRRLVGVLSVDDLMDVAQEEATEDMYQMVGLGTEETVFSPVRLAARRRIPWLLVNLATAFLSALTVSAFEDTISKVAVLAVFMPVVAGHGGNTGTQAITLVVRALALGEVEPADALRVMWKEVRFGLLHGAIVGVISAGVAFAVTGNQWLAAVLFCAMLGNVVLAAVVGSFLPLLMRRLGIDPALASAIWLTTFTDVMGFLLLLGLGSLLVDRLS